MDTGSHRVDRVDHPDREFQLWAYSVSIGRLVLRSNRTPEIQPPGSPVFPTRIDLLFAGVAELHVRHVMQGLVVRVAAPEEALRLAPASACDGDLRVYVLESGDHAGFVVASDLARCEDEGDYSEPSALWRPGPAWF